MIFNIKIRNISIYRQTEDYQNKKNKESVYICANDELFESGGTYFVILYIRNKSIPLSRFTTPNLYSDMIAELSDTHELCIYIQRREYPIPEPYYSERWGCYVTPAAMNSSGFCNRETSREEILQGFKKNILNKEFSSYVETRSNGSFVRFSKEVDRLISL